ncbi:MAG: cell division topological specificity factor [Pseudomonadota bacterium]|jgi:cell division topological specificity factor
MAFFDFFRKKSEAAQTAKDRLQIIVARERASTGGRTPSYLPRLQQELLEVISKYEKLDLDQVSVNLDRKGDSEVLEINIVLPGEAPVRAMRGGVSPVGA